MKALRDFTAKLSAEFSLNADLTVERAGRFFLLSRKLQSLIRSDFYYAGIYLGKVKNARFFPSFNLLAMLARGKANKVVVDRKAAWLFICGRDVFRRGVLTVHGSQRKGDYALVMNEFGECLGFGKILRSLDAAVKGAEVVVQNISDVGDFLRREL
jgi:ribosome biogenesis protein Nip4